MAFRGHLGIKGIYGTSLPGVLTTGFRDFCIALHGHMGMSF